MNLNSISTYIEVSYALIKATGYQLWQFHFDTNVTFSSKLSALHCTTVVWYCKKLQTLFLNYALHCSTKPKLFWDDCVKISFIRLNVITHHVFGRSWVQFDSSEFSLSMLMSCLASYYSVRHSFLILSLAEALLVLS